MDNPKAGCLEEIGGWLGQLSDEVKKVAALGDLLREIGCFNRPPTPANASPKVLETPPSAEGQRHASSAVIDDSAEGMGLDEGSQSTMDTLGQGIDADESGECISRKNEITLPTTENPTTSISGENIEASASYHKENGAKSKGVNDSGAKNREISVGGAYNPRAVESKVDEAVEGLKFHLSALYRAVDAAHISLRDASHEFGLLLQKVSLPRFTRGKWWEEDAIRAHKDQHNMIGVTYSAPNPFR